LAAGAVTVEQAQVIAAAVRDLPADVDADIASQAVDALVDAAGQFDPGPLRRLAGRILAHVAPDVAERADRAALAAEQKRARLRRGFTLTGDGAGGVYLRGRLDAEAAAVVTAAIDPLAAPGALLPAGLLDDRMAEQRRADAPVEICRLALTTGQLPETGGDRPQLVVTVPYHPVRREPGGQPRHRRPAHPRGGAPTRLRRAHPARHPRRRRRPVGRGPAAAAVHRATAPHRRAAGQGLRVPRLRPATPLVPRPPHHPPHRRGSDLSIQARRSLVGRLYTDYLQDRADGAWRNSGAYKRMVDVAIATSREAEAEKAYEREREAQRDQLRGRRRAEPQRRLVHRDEPGRPRP
jgi:hypothetical protein